MTPQEAYAQAFENGRAKGYKEGKRDAVKHTRMEYAGISAGKRIYRCMNCKTLIYGPGNYCKECGAIVDGINELPVSGGNREEI